MQYNPIMLTAYISVEISCFSSTNRAQTFNNFNYSVEYTTVLGHLGSKTKGSKGISSAQIGSRSEVSCVRSVLGPKRPVTIQTNG